jgi:hypothetical protein
MLPVHAVALVAEHSPQDPSPRQTGFGAWQSASLEQGSHECVVRLQTGWVSAHAEPLAAVHCTQVWVAGSHAGVAPLQSASVRQSTQSAFATSQIRLTPQTDELVAEHSAQAPLGWQAGVGLAQFASLLQPSHRFVPGLHTGTVPTHSARFAAVHCTHVWLAVLHAGVAPQQSASTRHPTQRAWEVSQTSLAAHSLRSVAEHWPQAPLD